MSFSNVFEETVFILNQEKETALRSLEELEYLLDNADEETLTRNFENIPDNDLISLEIQGNFELVPNSSFHYYMNNKTVLRIDSEHNEKTIEINAGAGNLYGQSVVEFRWNFYSIGGALPSGLALDLVSVFDFNGNFQSSKGLLETGRKFSVCVESNQKIFVIGGMKTNGRALDSIEIIDLVQFTNVGKIKMNIGRGYPSACVFNGFIYVASSESGYIEKFRYGNSEKTEKVTFGGDEKVKFIVAVDQYLVLFREKNYIILDSNERTLKKVMENIEFKWSQSLCGVSNSEVFFKDYFSGKINKINLQLP